MLTIRDITDEYAFVNETLAYSDGPIEGYVRDRTKSLYAFRCFPIVGRLLFHWSLVPVTSIARSVSDVFAEARTSPPERWISIVEDRRESDAELRVVVLSGAVAIPMDWD
jgi:hypothetical protein